MFQRFFIEKEKVVPSLPTTKVTNVYPLPLNEKKAIDVRVLAEKYVPAADQWYYRLVLGESPIKENQETEVVDVQGDDAYESDSSFM